MTDNVGGEADGACAVSDIPTWDNASHLTETAGKSKAQTNGKKKHGVMNSLRESIKRVGEKSPLSKMSRTEEANVGYEPVNTSDPQIQPPPSPSLSLGSLPSPQQKVKDLNPLSTKTFLPAHSRSQSDSVVALGDELPKKRETGRWSFRLGSKKEKVCKQEQLDRVTEVTLPETGTEVTGGEVNVRTLYTLPEIPSTPLSVMEIKTLIDNKVLEEAYLNLLSLRLEFQREKEALGEEPLPLELAHKEKDLQLLYNSLRTNLTVIVRDSCASHNKELLVYVACIIQEEEKREGDVAGMGGWRDIWRAAVQEGVRDTLSRVHLESHEQNPSWLALHLGLLGKAIVVDLEKVKAELLSSYPPSFNVFETYVSACHKMVGEHLNKLLGNLKDLRDYYALLNFIIHRYPSDKVMGRISLQPELKEEQRALKLDESLLEQIETGYYNSLQAGIRTNLDKITELEYTEIWKDKKPPEIEEEIYSSHIDMDIWMDVKGKIQASKTLNLDKAVHCCLEELKQFPKRFESAFVQYSDALEDPSLWVAYHITYINSFSALKNHMEDYRESCPNQVEQLGKEVDGFVLRLRHALLERFKTDTKPFLSIMMTRKWLSSDEDFQELAKRIRHLSQQCRHWSPEHVQPFVSDVHYSVVREYVSQMMKNNYTCKNSKNERAATKIREQWGELKELFQEMNSAQHWLYPVGDHLSNIIGHKNKSEIKNFLQPLVDDYPDISKRHLSAILYFRGITRGRERQIIFQEFSKQQSRNVGSTQQALFTEIPAMMKTDCLANLPFSCLYCHFPDN